MKTLLVLAALLVVAVILIALAQKTQGGKRRAGVPVAKPPLTEREQAMYFRLTEAFPEAVVLAQVPFSALLDSSDLSTRNTFDRKVADFAICTRGFAVLAVIELDDASHRGRERRDKARSLLLTSAGYTVLRYPSIPPIGKLREAIPAAAPNPVAVAVTDQSGQGT